MKRIVVYPSGLVVAGSLDQLAPGGLTCLLGIWQPHLGAGNGALHIFRVPATDQVTIAAEFSEPGTEMMLGIFDVKGILTQGYSALGAEAGHFITNLEICELLKGTYAVSL